MVPTTQCPQASVIEATQAPGALRHICKVVGRGGLLCLLRRVDGGESSRLRTRLRVAGVPKLLPTEQRAATCCRASIPPTTRRKWECMKDRPESLPPRCAVRQAPSSPTLYPDQRAAHPQPRIEAPLSSAPRHRRRLSGILHWTLAKPGLLHRFSRLCRARVARLCFAAMRGISPMARDFRS